MPYLLDNGPPNAANFRTRPVLQDRCMYHVATRLHICMAPFPTARAREISRWRLPFVYKIHHVFCLPVLKRPPDLSRAQLHACSRSGVLHNTNRHRIAFWALHCMIPPQRTYRAFASRVDELTGIRVELRGIRVELRPDSGIRVELRVVVCDVLDPHAGSEARLDGPRKADTKLPGKGNSNSHGARPST